MPDLVVRAARVGEWSEQAAAIVDPDALVLIAEREGRIIGRAKTHHYAEATADAPAGHYLGGVSVLPDYRQRGIGSVLTSARLDWIRERASEAWFFTNARNSASVALHARFGFEEVSRAPEFHGVAFDGGEGILFRTTLR